MGLHKRSNIQVTGVPEEEEKEDGAEKKSRLRHKPTESRSSVNPKQKKKKAKEIHSKTYHYQISENERQRKNLKSTHRKMTPYLQDKNNSN